MKKHFELEKPPASLPYPLVGAVVLILAVLALGKHFGWPPSSSVFLSVAFIALLYGVAFAFASIRRGVIGKRRDCGL